ncbi:2-oxoacid:acceptor oxidoreductase subunit alpha [Rhodococcus tibetensis]|uniref:2-oxoacid:acceptor oxidoreductase subunit alpha n=1 Tax=Rhodococcus tibetensis TaxID=2965064 RepID=A0ABT1QEZ2_9NOCA|nr:2-oxoacid:acceptor oxidoreductase subunit alpha [Rhodococcus sp. FXJ9.536]MCQ4120856.1 2-oxoacid:acceptor oxidoreductase subunit alpha [Rhodococcus sp. FXJ9.536]
MIVSSVEKQRLSSVVIRFAGDSGDGVQLAGDRFTGETAFLGNDLSTMRDFPAEIRAPAGTLAGVSSFQLQFADHGIQTAGDRPDVLVAMNPAALKAHLADLPTGAEIIVDSDQFKRRSLRRVGYESNPLEDGTLDGYRLHAVPLASITVEALREFPIGKKDAERARNMFALGLLCWMYDRPTESTVQFLRRRFPDGIADVNIAAFRAGYAFGDTTETFAARYEVRPARLPQGRYRNIAGNTALSHGLLVGAQRAGIPLFLGAYPITPASDLLHELARHKAHGVRTFQAEDEIAGIAAAIGASFGGHLGVTSTSGPGMSLKAEALGLAVALELPLVVCDIQRAGPSTGMPTKTEQADLLQAMFGRNGESPVPVLAPRSPSDCFDVAYEAVRIATKYRTPVILLSDAHLANSSEPWRLPDLNELPDIGVRFTTEPNHGGEFWPFLRDSETLARPWTVPGTPGLEHRIGGLEKLDGRGTISSDPDNHESMVRLRAARVAGIANDVAPLEVDDPGEGADVLVLGWGSTYGAICAAVSAVRGRGGRVAQAHLRHLNPFPPRTGEVLDRYRTVLIPELNLGQLILLIKATFGVDAVGYNRVRGLPFTAAELAARIEELI